MIASFINNRQRTEAAAMALESYIDAKGIDPDLQSSSETMTDLLTDLRHLAAAMGVDFDKAVTMSAYHYEEESS